LFGTDLQVKKEFSTTTISGILHVAMSNMGLCSANALALRLDIVIEIVKAGAPGMGMLKKQDEDFARRR
jgi:shikimate kinase